VATVTADRPGKATDQALLEALVALGGATAPGDLAQAAAIPARTVRAGLTRLEAAGYISRSHAEVALTLAGRDAATPLVRGGIGDTLDTFLDELLPPWQAAWARLLADAVVARRLFPTRRPQPCFVAFGPTGTAKTLAVIAICRLLGLDEADHIVLLDALAPGELLGRRVPGPGGRFSFVPSARLGDPLLCLDEFANATGALRHDTLKLLQGDPTVRIEDTTVAISPVPVVVFNPPPRAHTLPLLPVAIYRRAITIDTTQTTGALVGREARFSRFLASETRRVVDLEHIEAEVAEVPEEIATLLLLPRGDPSPLTPRGQQLWNAATLGCCLLGRLARWGGGATRLRAAAATVLLDALLCAETIPGTIAPTWRDQMGTFPAWLEGLPGAERFTETIERSAAVRATTEERAQANRVAKDAQALEVVERRGVLCQRLGDARGSITRVPAPYREEARGLRDVLKRLEQQAGDARSLDALADVGALAAPRLDQVAMLRRKIARAAEQDAQAKRVHAETEANAKDARRRLKEQAKAVERARRDQVAELRRRRSTLVSLRGRVRTRAGEDVVATLLAAGALEEEAPRTRPSDRRLTAVQMVAQAFAPRPERIVVDRAGHRWRAHELASWGTTAVTSVLEAAIAEIDSQSRRLA